MKKIFTLITVTTLLLACGNSSENAEASIDSLLESENVEALQEKKNALSAQQQALENQIKQLDEKLKSLSPEANVPLITAFTAKTETFNHYLELQGSVETDQNIVITPEMGGILKQVYVDEGRRVSKGQVLATIDDGGLSQQLAQMKIQAALAKTTFERQERLWNQKIGSEIQYLQAKSNFEAQQEAVNQMEKQLRKTKVVAPFSGTIDDVITEQGNVVSPGQTPLFRIVNLTNMHIKTDVPEGYISDITKNKTVEVEFPVLNKSITSKISQTGSYINPNNRTYEIEIPVPNKDKMIKPNLTARLKINDYTSEEAILIPQNIISENANGEQYVYILKNVEGKKAVAERIIIKTGKMQGDVIEVLEGLENGDQIIEEGARSVKNGQTVQIMNV